MVWMILWHNRNDPRLPCGLDQARLGDASPAASAHAHAKLSVATGVLSENSVAEIVELQRQLEFRLP